MTMILEVEIDGKPRVIEFPDDNPVKVIFRDHQEMDNGNANPPLQWLSDLHVTITDEGIVLDVVHEEGEVEETTSRTFAELLNPDTFRPPFAVKGVETGRFSCKRPNETNTSKRHSEDNSRDQRQSPSEGSAEV